MKKILLIIIVISLSCSVRTQTIPKIKVSTSEFDKIFSCIRNNTYDNNIIGKKITLSKTKTKSEWQSSKDGIYTVLKINIESNSDFGLIVYFNQLELPDGSSICAYSYNNTYKTKLFHHNYNKLSSSFALPLIKSNKITVEARIPTIKMHKFIANISEIGCVPINSKVVNGFGATNSCYVNVNCHDASQWSNQKRAVVRYTFTEGSDIGNCTGTLLNNTAQDNRNYFLSAQHCAMGASAAELGQAIFYFNYESPNCDNPANDDGLTNETVIGCTRIAASGDGTNENGFPDGSDFHLFELNPIPVSYNVYYAGWNRNDVNNLSGPGAIIQHPLSDIKKISFVSNFIPALTNSDMEAITTTTTGGQGGNVEANSSGSAMFDNLKLVVGTISYGSEGCVNSENDSGAGGKLFYHWDKNGSENNRKLAPWLDPSNTGVMTLGGKNSGSVGVENINQSKNNILIYPNPAHNNIYLEYINVEKLNKIKISLNNINGILVFEDEIYLHENNKLNIIDITNLKSGMYFITISNLNNKFYKTSKLIKL